MIYKSYMIINLGEYPGGNFVIWKIFRKFARYFDVN